ncbi:MAG: PKD domain-containing protein, partial [Microbacterium sp.]
MEFLLVTLELNPPDGVLAWADRVIDAHPDHRVIVATHAYINTTGALSNQVQRTDQPGNSGAQVFQKLIRPHCNVFLVVNGHFSDGTLGEARRSDQNACGGTVHGILTDFQGRPNGGDGWLRYYRFVPASNEIEAVTYSPTRNEYERDADSSFVLPYDMTVAGGTQPELGSVTVDPGATASIDLPDLPSGTEFEWYASVSDGTATTESARWTVTVSDEVPPLAVDTFSRTSTAGWGTADTGGAWTVNSAAKFTVAGGVGRIAANAGSTLTATLPSVSTTDIDLQTTLAVDKLPQQRLDLTVFTRLIGTGGYAARLKLQPTGALTIEAVRDTTVLATRTLPAGTVTAGTPLRIRIQTQGTAPTTVRARVWTGTTEPTTWHVTATDTTAALQQPGTLRLTSYLSSSATNGPVTVTYDDLRAGSSQTPPPPPPPNAAPTAAFTWTAQGRTVTADSGDSVDADGQIVSRTWSFDGATKTGTTATHTFAQAGTFPVSLTVTDDDGATNTVTKTVTVSDEV